MDFDGRNVLETKIKEIWLKEGDRNTSFFHKMTNAHRRRNQMARVKINVVY